MEADNQVKTLMINELKTGMYVTAIASQGGKSQVTRAGLITSRQQIAHLKKLGVMRVQVDFNRSKLNESSKIVEQSSSSSKQSQEKLSPSAQQARAKKIFNEAKSLQSKYFQQLAKGEPIDIKPMERAAEGMIESLGEYSDAFLFLAKIREKDKYLMEHSLNVGMLLAYFGRSLGQDKHTQKQLLMGGMLHDIGKINTPDHILHKPGRLTDEEMEVMREHVVHSRLILEKQPGVTEIMLEVAANHHERLDGLGYPRKLKGEQLSIHTRMSNIVDCYDALTADRVYKSGMPPTAAFRILLKGAGTQFDKVLLEKFIRCMGVYPIGTLVKLQSGKLGIVTQRNELKPLRPVLKVVFNTNTNTHTEVKSLDLQRFDNEEIVEAVSARDYGLSLDDYIER